MDANRVSAELNLIRTEIQLILEQLDSLQKQIDANDSNYSFDPNADVIPLYGCPAFPDQYVDYINTASIDK